MFGEPTLNDFRISKILHFVASMSVIFEESYGNFLKFLVLCTALKVLSGAIAESQYHRSQSCPSDTRLLKPIICLILTTVHSNAEFLASSLLDLQ